MIQIIDKSILYADEQYIVHQLNCLTNRSAGLAAAIFKEFPYADVYSHRQYPHTPTQSERMGNIVIRGNGQDQRFIIGIYGQYYPGSPKYPDSQLDGYIARERAFQEGLNNIGQIKNLTSIAFPVGIGCTLAGGDWYRYRSMIEQFESAHDFDVFLYQYSKKNC